LTQVDGTLRTKMPEIMHTFHYALDDIETEIVCLLAFANLLRSLLTLAKTRAKAVLSRDLEKLKAKRMPVGDPSNDPMVIDLDSPLEEATPVKPVVAYKPSQRMTNIPVAPFPDMGMPMSVSVASSQGKNTEQPAPQKAPAAPMPATSINTAIKLESNPTTIPHPAVLGSVEGSMSDLFTLSEAGNGASSATNPELNFTDMEFSLAPSGNEAQSHEQTQQTDFDLAGFTSSEVGDGMLSLDSLLPSARDGQQAKHGPPQATDEAAGKPEDSKQEKQESSNEDDIFALNAGTSADSMDLDLDLGTGDGDASNFDDLFFDTGDTQLGGLTEMEHGQFDDAYFGLQ
jgi:hypothetical protein